MGQNYRLISPSVGLSSSLVNFIYEDKYGVIWIATEDGLNKYDGVKITSYKHLDGDDTSLASNYVSTMIEDARGNLVVSTYVGLQIYRHDTDDFSPLSTKSDGKFLSATISKLKLESDGRLYGTGDVPCEIVTSGNNKVTVFPMDEPYFDSKLPDGLPADLNIYTTLHYDDNHLLLGTDGDGVKLYDERQGTYTDYPLDIPGIPQNQQKVHHLMRDRSGNLWIALYQKGVVMVSGHKSPFGYIGYRTSQQDLIGSHCVLSICRGRDGGMWVGTDGDGLYHLSGNKSVHYTEGLPPIVNAVMEDSEGVLWIGSYGFPCYRVKSGVSEEVKGMPQHPQVFAIVEDHRQNVWLGTMGNGLYCYDRKRGRIIQFEDKNINRFINCLYVCSNGDVLAGTYYGVYNVTTRHNFCMKQIVYAIYEDSGGRLWVGTANGLWVTDGKKERVFTTADGMSSNTVFAITQDEKGLLWFSSNAGLTSFDEKKGVFTNYSVNDGLQGNEFSKGAVLKDKDGTLWFAGHEGITYFAEGNISRYPYDLHPRITDLYINNVPVNTKTTTGGENVIDTTLYDCRLFNIAYENNSFTIELSTREIDKPAQCSFLYSLDGQEWIVIPEGGHHVSFSNLGTGRHSFRYAVEYNGNRSPGEEVQILVRSPWWGTIWVRMFIFLVLVSILILLFFWIKSREKVKALSIISHKIRTPMSLIVSPLVQLMDDDKDETRQKTYRLMLRNAQRLQQLAAQATREEPIGPIAGVDVGTGEDDMDIQRSRTTRQLVIVEDDDEVRNYLCRELSADYHVYAATNGKEALELIFQKMPDAIVSDVTMPQMDGITLCRKLKKNIQLAHIPVLLLTARADEESTLQGLGIGADAYVTKPFNIKILRQNIANLITLRQQLRNTYQARLMPEDKLEKMETEDSDGKFMERLMNAINRHLADPDYSIEMLCSEVGVSRTGLHRKLKEKTNQSASVFIRNVRLKQGEKLLLETNLRIAEIAVRVGFKQVSYFIDSFKNLYGVTPTEFRAKNMQ